VTPILLNSRDHSRVEAATPDCIPSERQQPTILTQVCSFSLSKLIPILYLMFYCCFDLAVTIHDFANPRVMYPRFFKFCMTRGHDLIRSTRSVFARLEDYFRFHCCNRSNDHLLPDQIYIESPKLDTDSHSVVESVCNIDFMPDLNSLLVKGSIHDNTFSFLIDTGAMVTLIHSKLVQHDPQLRERFNENAVIRSLRAVNGQNMTILGQVPVPFTIGNKIYTVFALVADGLTYDVIIGKDFLQQFDAIINFKDSTLQLTQPPNHSTFDSVQTKPSVNNATVHVLYTLELPARSETIIPGLVEGSLSGTIGILEPLRLLADKLNICGASSLVTLSSNQIVPVQLLNPTTQPITLYRHAVLGNFIPLDEHTVNSISDCESSEPSRDAPTKPRDIKVDLSQSDLNTVQQSQLHALLAEFSDIFAHSNYELGRTDLVKHPIEIGDTLPIRSRPYRVSNKQREVIDTHVKDMLDRKIISHSVSPWASPVVLVPKPDGSTRFCVDYRKLNAVTKKDSFPLPRIDQSIDSMGGSQYFSTMDLLSGYWQIGMAEGSKERTAFITYGGLYHFNVLPFGLTNAPATFQRLMESILRGLNHDIALCYIDDIIVFSKSFTQHLIDLRKVFLRLRHANIRLKPSKCKFGSPEVKYLGHVISRDGIAPNPDKIAAVKDFPVPKNVKGVRSFLGLANYYRRFVCNFAKIAVPLNALTRKDKKFVWTTDCQSAFDFLKTSLCTAPILAYPDFTQEFILHVDASDHALGYVLAQKQNDKEVVIAYAGRDLNPAERNYSATEREALGVVAAIKRFRPYLHGQKFIVYTDHNALKWLMNIKDPSGKLARWSLLLQQFDFTIEHRPGVNNGNADALSRRSYANLNVVDIPQTMIQQIQSSQRQDSHIVDFINYLETDKLPDSDQHARRILLDIENYFLNDDGLLFHRPYSTGRSTKNREPRLVIPNSLKHEILVQCHDSPLAGHLGLQKTYDKIKTRYFWKGMYKDCDVWIRSCVDCCMKKNPRVKTNAPILPIPVESAFERLSVDCLGPFPKSHSGKRYIICFIDALTKWPEAFAVENIDAVTTARLLVDEIVCRHGAPRTLLSDRGANFLSKLVREVCKLINTKKINTSSYHPQTNGLVERFNGSIAKALSNYVSSDQKDWDTFIPSVLFGYRTSPALSTGESPFYLLYGREPRLPLDVALLPPANLSKSIADHRARIVRNIEIAHEIARKNIQLAQQKMKEYHDRRATCPEYNVGDRVWIYTPAVPVGLSKKLRHLWHGPYRIIEQLSPVHFALRTCDNRRLAAIIHANRLKPYYDPSNRPVDIPSGLDNPNEPCICEDEFPEDSFDSSNGTSEPNTQIPQAQRPPTSSNLNTNVQIPSNQTLRDNPIDAPKVNSDQPVQLHETEPVYQVEKILKHRRRYRKLEYLVKWVGSSNPTWEPARNILDHNLIMEYEQPHTNPRQH